MRGTRSSAKRAGDQQRQPQPRRPEEALGVDERPVDRDRRDHGQRAHDDSDAYEQGVGTAIHGGQSRRACAGAVGQIASRPGSTASRTVWPDGRVRAERRDGVGLAHAGHVDDQPDLLRRRPRRPDLAAAARRRGPGSGPSAVRRPRAPAAGQRPRGWPQPPSRGRPGRSRGTAPSRGRPARARPRRSAPPGPPGPARITAIRSATVKASSWSWVTISAVVPAACRMSRRSVASRSRRPASSAESGSSSSSSRGSAASARASATRWRSPPERVAGSRSPYPARPTRSSSSATRGRGVRGPAQAQRVADVAGHGQVPEQLAVLEQQREAALVGGYAGQVGAVPAHAPRGERLETGDGPQQRGLAAARRSEHGQHLPVGQLEVDVDDGRHPVVGHRDVVQRQHQIVPIGTCSRSTSSITPAVVAASTTDAARAMP